MAWAVLLYALVAFLPGLAVLHLLGLRPTDPLVRLGLAAGLGLALQPLVYLWAHLVHLPLGARLWWLLLASCAAYLLAAHWRGWRASADRGISAAAVRARLTADPAIAAQVATVVLLALVLASRWWAARALAVPLWGDSVHHTVIVRLLAEHGGLVDHWLPFAPLSTFTYHIGFHTTVVTLVWLTGLPAPQAVILAGQMLMVFQVLAAYALAAGLTGRPWAGLGAALAAGGLSTMPAYYINWGRYTQLAGQVLLPAAALLSTWVARPHPLAPSPAQERGSKARDLAKLPLSCASARERRPGGEGLAAALLVAGLFLTHYLVVIFYGLFMLAWLAVGWAWRPGGLRARALAAGRLVVLALASGILVLPWLPRLAAGQLGGMAVGQVTGASRAPARFGVVPAADIWGDYGPLMRHVGPGLVVALLAALAVLAVRRRLVALGLLWLGLLLLATHPGLTGLPVSGLIKDLTLAISLYLPAGLVIGGALDWGMEVLEEGAWPRSRRVRSAGAAAAAVVLAAWLAWRGREVVDPHFMLATPADVRAMAWIRHHTPPEAVFLVSSFEAFGDTVIAGDDGGWWLQLLTDRRSTLPPIVYGLERSFAPGYREQVNHLYDLWHADLDAPETRAALRAAGVTHAYVGPKAKGLKPSRLAASPHWELLYDEDAAQVYRLKSD